jgi:hypothetical protein
MRNPPRNDRSSPLSMGSVYRFVSLSEMSGLLGGVAGSFNESGRSRRLLILSLGVLSSGMMASAAKAQMVVKRAKGICCTTGDRTPDNPLVGESIDVTLSECGGTF